MGPIRWYSRKAPRSGEGRGVDTCDDVACQLGEARMGGCRRSESTLCRLCARWTGTPPSGPSAGGRGTDGGIGVWGVGAAPAGETALRGWRPRRHRYQPAASARNILTVLQGVMTYFHKVVRALKLTSRHTDERAPVTALGPMRRRKNRECGEIDRPSLCPACPRHCVSTWETDLDRQAEADRPKAVWAASQPAYHWRCHDLRGAGTSAPNAGVCHGGGESGGCAGSAVAILKKLWRT